MAGGAFERGMRGGGQCCGVEWRRSAWLARPGAMAGIVAGGAFFRAWGRFGRLREGGHGQQSWQQHTPQARLSHWSTIGRFAIYDFKTLWY